MLIGSYYSTGNTGRVATGGLEPVLMQAFDVAGAAKTGVTDLALTVRRHSDGFIYDWSDDTFKVSGWVTPTMALTQLSAANLPGLYYLTATGHVRGWNTATPTNNAANDTLHLFVSGGTGVAGTPGVGELKVGGAVDSIGTVLSDTTDLKTRVPAALVTGRMDASVGAVVADGAIADAVWDEQVRGHRSAGTFGRQFGWK